MDKLDTKLIAHLRRDGRASLSDLSLALGVTRATIRTRLDRLRENGEILGFSAVLRTDVEQHVVRGIILIEITGRGTSAVIESLDRLPEVQAVHTTNGKWDVVCELGTSSLPELDAVLRRIRLIAGVSNSETNLYLTTQRATGLAS